MLHTLRNMDWSGDGTHFEVSYNSAESMAGEFQAEVVEALAVAKGSVSLLFVVPVMTVSPSVPNFWLETLDRLGSKVLAMAIVSSATPVRMMAGLFQVAARLRAHPLEVQVFHDADEARRWLRSRPGLQPPAQVAADG